MQVEKYLRENQPIIYKTFLNELNSKRLSHAYLLSGNPGTPLLEVATFLAKTILCDDPTPFACNNCITCLRVDSQNYPDFIVYDGSKGTIKKDEVSDIEIQFEKKAFEAKGIMIYVIHLVENMTTEAVNAILKFLEEPEAQIYAFLTTNNESAVLPTIISRCQTLRIKPVSRQKVINESVQLGVNLKDAELLSYFYNDSELLQESMQEEDKSFESARDSLEELLDALNNDNTEYPVYVVLSKITSKVKSKESARFFLDILAQFFEDIISIKNGKLPILTSYDTILRELSDKLPHVEDSLVEILKSRNVLNTNVSVSLLFNHLINRIVEE